MTDDEIEAAIQAKGLTAPRVTTQDIANKIAECEYWRVPKSTTTVCALTLQNGFVVVSSSGCIDPSNFDEDLGRRIARRNGIDKLWELEGYLQRQVLAEKLEDTAGGA